MIVGLYLIIAVETFTEETLAKNYFAIRSVGQNVLWNDIRMDSRSWLMAYFVWHSFLDIFFMLKSYFSNFPKYRNHFSTFIFVRMFFILDAHVIHQIYLTYNLARFIHFSMKKLMFCLFLNLESEKESK